MEIRIDDFKAFFDLVEDCRSFSEVRQEARKKLGEVFTFPKYRYSSFVNMMVPKFSLEPEDIKTVTEADISVDAEDDVKVYHNLSDEFVETHMKKYAEDLKEGVDNLHKAFMNSSLVVEIPDDHISQRPIEITVDSKDDVLFSSIFIIAGVNSMPKIILKKRSASSKYSSLRINVLARSGSNVNYVDVQDMSHDTVLHEKTFLHADDSATIKTYSACFGSRYSKQDYYAELDGDGSSSEMRLLYLTNGRRKHNIHTESRHNAKSSYSDILTKGVVADRAKALCTGNVNIRENAFASSGYETQRALMISKDAEADAIPNLEIHNHDVTCSHGSTVGQIDEEKVFYLMSRGMTRKRAELLIIRGFFTEILEEIGDDEIASSVDKQIHEALDRKFEDEGEE